MILRIDDELDIVQSLNADGRPQLLRVLQNNALDLIGNGEGRVHGDGVAGVNAGALHQLHDAGDEHVRPVADGVDLHLFAPDILIHQHRLVRVDLHGGVEVMPQLLLVGDDLHCPSAQHEAGTHQNGIADLPGGGDAVLNAGDGLSLGLGDVQGNQKLFKGVPVFRLFDCGAVGADDVHA